MDGLFNETSLPPLSMAQTIRCIASQIQILTFSFHPLVCIARRSDLVLFFELAMEATELPLLANSSFLHG